MTMFRKKKVDHLKKLDENLLFYILYIAFIIIPKLNFGFLGVPRLRLDAKEYHDLGILLI